VRKKQQKVILRKHTAAIFGIVSGLLLLAHCFQNPVYRFGDEALWRLRFGLLRQIRPGRQVPGILILEDEGKVSLERLARAIEILDQRGAKTIGVDLPLDRRRITAQGEARLVTALQSSGKVILSSQAKDATALEVMQEPSPLLAKAALEVAFSVLAKNSQGEVSRVALAGLTRDASTVGWPLALLYHHLSVPAFARFLKDNVVTLKIPGQKQPRKIPLDSTGAMRIHYRFRHLLERRALTELESGALESASIQGRLVILPARSLDRKRTLKTPLGRKLSRSLVLGCAVATLLTGDVLIPASRALEVGCILLLALPLILLGWKKEPLWTLGGAILCSVAWWVLALGLLASSQIILPLARPLGLVLWLLLAGLLRHHFRTLVGVVRSDVVKLHDSQAALNLGIKMMQAGKVDESIKYFQQVASAEGAVSSKGSYMLALVLLKKGDTTSVTNLVRSIDMETLNEEEAYQLAEELESHGQLDTAHTVFSKLMQTNISYRDVKDRLRTIQDRLSGVTEEDIARMVVNKILDRRFEQAELIGRGGMGFVYKARDSLAEGRIVALKVLSPFYANHEDVYRRFIREAEGIASFDCPQIIEVYDVFQENLPYYSMEFLTSASLKDVLKAGRLPLDRILHLSQDACLGLDYAHKRGITHRDIKPDNIMLNEDSGAKVIDFGIAHFEDQTAMTQTGNTIGTPLYMSPEQVKGLDIDHRSDIYSFGVVLYEMLAGETPFQAMSEHLTRPAPPLPPNLQIPDLMQRIVSQALAKHQEERFQSMEEFREALQMVEVSL
jgi:CHASE2 domain-containing sensor protein